MKHIKEIYNMNIDIKDFDVKETLFFDIETTGLSAHYNFIYIIGFVYYNCNINSYELNILLAENRIEEEHLIKEFNNYLKRFKHICHFNGQTFDIPFLIKRGLKYNINLDFNSIFQTDLYKKFRFLKKPLELSSMKQKNLESFLGWNRDDQFNGGELIKFYYEYEDTKDYNIENLLVLHNMEDLKGMLLLLHLHSYSNIFNQDNYPTTILQMETHITLKSKLDLPILSNISKSNNLYKLNIESDFIHIELPYINDQFKHYIKDYKNYYYLPVEDRAIHKSVGQFVDKNFRKQATASTCYLNINSNFIWTPDASIQPIFKKSFSDKINFIEYNKITNENSDLYIRAFLNSLL